MLSDYYPEQQYLSKPLSTATSQIQASNVTVDSQHFPVVVIIVVIICGITFIICGQDIPNTWLVTKHRSRDARPPSVRTR